MDDGFEQPDTVTRPTSNNIEKIIDNKYWYFHYFEINLQVFLGLLLTHYDNTANQYQNLLSIVFITDLYILPFIFT